MSFALIGSLLLLAAALSFLFNLDLLRGWLVEHFRTAADLIRTRLGG